VASDAVATIFEDIATVTIRESGDD
jgi:hypothetical protein